MRYPIIEHHGARDGVTGSCHQLHMNAASSLLIDCGLFQGDDACAVGTAGANRLAIEFSVATVKALVATHVHIDHVGRIPYLLAAGFDGPIVCSEPPVILDSPLAHRFTEAYRELQPYWNQEAREQVAAGRDPLAFDNLITIDSHTDHIAVVNHLTQTARPAIVIAGGGMCAGGAYRQLPQGYARRRAP